LSSLFCRLFCGPLGQAPYYLHRPLCSCGARPLWPLIVTNNGVQTQKGTTPAGALVFNCEQYYFCDVPLYRQIEFQAYFFLCLPFDNEYGGSKSLETFVSFYPTTRNHIPEGTTHYRCEDSTFSRLRLRLPFSRHSTLLSTQQILPSARKKFPWVFTSFFSLSTVTELKFRTIKLRLCGLQRNVLTSLNNQ
jgi:hypothetical protein